MVLYSSGSLARYVKRHTPTVCHDDNKCHEGKVSISRLQFQNISKKTFKKINK